jgi:hypothetical protein
VEIFRYSRTVYGQEVLQGMSWDLIVVFFGLGVAFVVMHGAYRLWFAPKRR